MPEYFFDLGKKDQREALEYVRAESGRPIHLLEKDLWVVWMLRTLFDSPLSVDLTFKGGTSPKVYKIIDRFSEDIDLIGDSGDLPANRSQAGKWTQAVQSRLPEWIAQHVQPLIQEALDRERLAAHVFCAQGRIRSERYARHWHDLTAIARSPHFTVIIADRAVATTVARHKPHFFVEKDADGQAIDYMSATTGHLKIVPKGQARKALAEDYTAMLVDEMMVGDALSFDDLLEACADLEARINRAAM